MAATGGRIIPLRGAITAGASWIAGRGVTGRGGGITLPRACVPLRPSITALSAVATLSAVAALPAIRAAIATGCTRGTLALGPRRYSAAVQKPLGSVDDDLVARIDAAGEDHLRTLGEIHLYRLRYDVKGSTVAASAAACRTCATACRTGTAGRRVTLGPTGSLPAAATLIPPLGSRRTVGGRRPALHDEYEVSIASGLYCSRGNDDCIRALLEDQPDVDELVREQVVICIREDGLDLVGSGR